MFERLFEFIKSAKRSIIIVLVTAAIASWLAVHFAAKPGTRVRILAGLFEYEKRGGENTGFIDNVGFLIASAPFPMAFVDNDDVVQLWNAHLETLLDYRDVGQMPLQVLVAHFEALVPATRLPAFIARQAELFKRAEIDPMAAVFDAEYLLLPARQQAARPVATHLIAWRALDSNGRKIGTCFAWLVEPAHVFLPPP